MWRPLVMTVIVLTTFACSEGTTIDDTATTTSPNLGTRPNTTTVSSSPTSTMPSESAGASSTSATTSTIPVTETSDLTTPQPLKVLVFHKTSGFTHESIPAGVEAITDLGREHGFEATSTDDASMFSDVGLQPFDVIVFLNTTGDILQEEQEHAMQRFIEGGKGFVGIHSAADTEYEWSWYEQLVGAYFERHPEPQPGRIEVSEPQHPAVQNLPSTFERFDEWYDFKNRPTGDAVVLATLDEESYEGGGMGDPHPIIWANEGLGGRSLYTGFGHTVESFSEPLVLEHLANGILWAGRSEQAVSQR